MVEPVAERPTMPGYGVDGPGWRPLPWSWAAAKLAVSRNLWLVTASADGRPHALPVWGVWDESTNRFGWSSSARSRKVANIAANPQACVTVDDTVECVSVEGRAALVTDPIAVDGWIDRFLVKYEGEGVTADFLRSHAFLELVPDRAFGVIERADEFATRATRWRFG
ncbi:MAG: pyridoxamine 5'-phosphate oxidase family protein [Acidimicrobiia bacterium]|nr:pyridoxamine 5'-phosphate oxidase family protein [Acidimicrobiia bacterium]